MKVVAALSRMIGLEIRGGILTAGRIEIVVWLELKRLALVRWLLCYVSIIP